MSRHALDFVWRGRMKQLHEALLIGSYTTTEWCNRLGYDRGKVYALYTLWRKETGTAKVPRLRRG